MRKLLLLFTFILTTTIVFGQSSSTQIKTRENDNPRFTQIFYVLKSDTSIKHGSYQRLGFNDEIILAGSYKLGKRDSLWVEFLRFSTIITSKGYYANDKKVGVWEYYDSKGILCLKYDYNTNSQVFSLKEKEGNISEMFMKNDTGVVSVRLQRDPFFNGDEQQLWKFLGSNLQYPQEALQKGLKGTVYVSFFIDQYGRAKDHKILRGINEQFNNEALRVVRLIPNDWIPAIYDGQVVTSQYHIPVRFSLK